MLFEDAYDQRKIQQINSLCSGLVRIEHDEMRLKAFSKPAKKCQGVPLFHDTFSSPVDNLAGYECADGLHDFSCRNTGYELGRFLAGDWQLHQSVMPEPVCTPVMPRDTKSVRDSAV
jgi:hypothetical protein